MSFVIDEKYVGRAVLRQDDPHFAVVMILAPVHFPVEIPPHTAEQASQVWTFHVHVAAQFFTCETHRFNLPCSRPQAQANIDSSDEC